MSTSGKSWFVDLTPCYCKKSNGLGLRFVTIEDGRISVTSEKKGRGIGREKFEEKINRKLRKSHVSLEPFEETQFRNEKKRIFPLKIKLRDNEKITLYFA